MTDRDRARAFYRLACCFASVGTQVQPWEHLSPGTQALWLKAFQDSRSERVTSTGDKTPTPTACIALQSRARGEEGGTGKHADP